MNCLLYDDLGVKLYTSICCYCMFEKTENKRKEAEDGPFYKNNVE